MTLCNRVLSTYTADVSGVCSALYELGGMTVMHDASGCNSTYNTHDEPRWYEMDSMVYISALCEADAIMGGDEKLVRDVVSCALELHPKFIALAGTPIPALIGMDFQGVAALIAEKTGVVTFGFPTNGMHSYISGAGMAFKGLADRLVKDAPSWMPAKAQDTVRVNILGLTPLDFSVTGSAEAIKRALCANGLEIVSAWAMGSALAEIENAACAHVNLVVSAAGIPAAQALKSRFGTPYVTGIPIGQTLTRRLIGDLCKKARGEKISVLPAPAAKADPPAYIVGEAVFSAALRDALQCAGWENVRVLCPLETYGAPLAADDLRLFREREIEDALKNARAVIADPLYLPVAPKGAKFIPLAHEAYSGRMFRGEIPVLIADKFEKWLEEIER